MTYQISPRSTAKPDLTWSLVLESEAAAIPPDELGMCQQRRAICDSSTFHALQIVSEEDLAEPQVLERWQDTDRMHGQRTPKRVVTRRCRRLAGRR
jgi:hypothetical protein